ncbi:MAG: fused MFS/spermidine synthase [Candidatus Limnocylindrales bacterium]
MRDIGSECVRAGESSTRIPVPDKRIILLVFMLSGFAGLVYEVVWARQLVLVFGNTTQAISAILTGFFGGMAIGSVLGGRIADRVRSPLRMYALLELLVVVGALITPVAFGGLREIYRGAFGILDTSPLLLALVRFGLAILVLGPATVFMGASLPTLSRHLVSDHTQLGEEFGELYMANTLGAIGGAFLAGVVLIELLGLNETLLVGAAGSGTAGLIALRLSRRDGRPAGATGAPARERGTVAASSASRRTAPALERSHMSRPRLALIVAFVSGLTSLGYQTLWNRILSSGTGSTNYIFTAILVFFLAGIAIGAFVFSMRLARSRQPVALLGLAEIALALLVLVTLGVETNYFSVFPLAVQLVLVVAPATVVMGIVFPMSSMLVADSDEHVGMSAGMLLGSNTVGAICGTFIVPFFLMPTLTSPRSIVLLAGINALTGLALLNASGSVHLPIHRIARVAAAVATAAAALLIVVPNQIVADPLVNRVSRDKAQVLASAEDSVASVQAVNNNNPGNPLSLYVGGTSMTSLSVDTRLMAHLPLMTRPGATSMCVIAFGMGSGFHSAMMDGLTTEAVELVPTVPGMFGNFFPDANQVVADPRGSIVIADGRNFLELTTHKFDLMIVDPPPPMNSSGTAVLFSREFYQAGRSRLNPDGVMVEWEYNGQTVNDMRSHVRTFRSVFAHVTLVFSRSAGLFMLGSDEPIDLGAAGIQTVLSKPGVLDDLRGAPDSPGGVETAAQWQDFILGNVWISDAAVDAFGASGTMITDDRPYTEYDFLRHLLAPNSPQATEAELLKAMPRQAP